jgi:acetyltransferase-like isoleucine patch superfamily enzyme
MIRIIVFSFIEYLIRDIPGAIGQKVRYFYFKNRFKVCGTNVRICEGVIFENPENISIGNDVIIHPYSVLTAMPNSHSYKNRILKVIKNENYTRKNGEIIIGNEVGIGVYNIINGYGGVKICNRVTTSARVSIYSLSHYPFDESNRSIITYANAMVKSDNISCIESPVVIYDGVWLGLNVIVLGGTIGKNSFVSANSIVTKSIKENSYASGSPAVKIKNRFNY